MAGSCSHVKIGCHRLICGGIWFRRFGTLMRYSRRWLHGDDNDDDDDDDNYSIAHNTQKSTNAIVMYFTIITSGNSYSRVEIC